ncbi:MAG: M23 family metallopeptidase, partial [Deltaproteobacteria bacterium]|nr:M23 family metallopeptidase [Deltaproteobacteria bacterium]
LLSPNATARGIYGPLYPRAMAQRGPRPPWTPRKRDLSPPMLGEGWGLVDLNLWPDEPPSPRRSDAKRFARALGELCGGEPLRVRIERLARAILRYSHQFGVDPFLMGAIVFAQSRCRVRRSSRYGVGLTAINWRMFARHVRAGRYPYWAMHEGRWTLRTLDLGRYAFTPANLRRVEPNIYFSAALLKMYREQAPFLRRSMRSAPYRHYVSHFVWGDRVRGAGPEDRILLHRRRLIGYFLSTVPKIVGKYRGLDLVCPLDGQPRKVTGILGDDRDGGRRLHTGIDFESFSGEQVRAIADGRVILAGVDWRNTDVLESLPSKVAQSVAPSKIGPRGLIVEVRHQHGLVSSYMHLQRYVVQRGDSVRRGQLVGYVGRTGIKTSPPHLHFELSDDQGIVDPLPLYRGALFGPQQTYRGRRRLRAQEQARRWRNGRRRLLRPPSGVPQR